LLKRFERKKSGEEKKRGEIEQRELRRPVAAQ